MRARNARRAAIVAKDDDVAGSEQEDVSALQRSESCCRPSQEAEVPFHAIASHRASTSDDAASIRRSLSNWAPLSLCTRTTRKRAKCADGCGWGSACSNWYVTGSTTVLDEGTKNPSLRAPQPRACMLVMSA